MTYVSKSLIAATPRSRDTDVKCDDIDTLSIHVHKDDTMEQVYTTIRLFLEKNNTIKTIIIDNMQSVENNIIRDILLDYNVHEVSFEYSEKQDKISISARRKFLLTHNDFSNVNLTNVNEVYIVRPDNPEVSSIWCLLLCIHEAPHLQKITLYGKPGTRETHQQIFSKNFFEERFEQLQELCVENVNLNFMYEKTQKHLIECFAKILPNLHTLCLKHTGLKEMLLANIAFKHNLSTFIMDEPRIHTKAIERFLNTISTMLRKNERRKIRLKIKNNDRSIQERIGAINTFGRPSHKRYTRRENNAKYALKSLNTARRLFD